MPPNLVHWVRLPFGLYQWFSALFGTWRIYSKKFPIDYFAMLSQEQLLQTGSTIQNYVK